MWVCDWPSSNIAGNFQPIRMIFVSNCGACTATSRVKLLDKTKRLITFCQNAKKSEIPDMSQRELAMECQSVLCLNYRTLTSWSHQLRKKKNLLHVTDIISTSIYDNWLFFTILADLVQELYGIIKPIRMTNCPLSHEHIIITRVIYPCHCLSKIPTQTSKLLQFLFPRSLLSFC